MVEIKIVKPKIWNFEILKDKKAWEEVVWAARMSGVPGEIQGEKVFKMMVRNDYGSALEHVICKFDIKMTKGNAPELLEHRMASHSGYSTRYIRVYEGIDRERPGYEIILPPNLKEKEVFLQIITENLRFYERLLNRGLPKETARYVLPFCLAVGTYHFTINLRSLLNLLGLRLCVRASPEFRCIAAQIYFHLLEKLPLLRGLVGCRGLMRGCCPESDVTGVRVGKQLKFYPPCPFKNKNSEIYIPTVKEVREKRKKSFNLKKAIQIQEKIFLNWANWQ